EERVLRRREDEVPDPHPVEQAGAEPAKARRGVDDRPPEQDRRGEEGQVLEIVERRTPERRLVEPGVVPAPEDEGVETPRDRHPREPPEGRPDRSGAREDRAHDGPEPWREPPR